MITLYNLDCMEYMRTLPDKAFDLAIVDPPLEMCKLLAEKLPGVLNDTGWHSPQERPQSRRDVLADLGPKRGLVIGHAESSGDRWWVILNQTKDPEIAVSAAEIKRWCYVKECIR